MQRPFGVTLLAVGAGIAGLYQIWRILVFAGIANWTFIGKEISFSGNPQWGQIFWCAILALIWFWVAAGFWNVRAYAWSFGNFISLFTFIWGFFEVLFGSSVEAETIPWFLALVIFMYLNYPGVRQHFYDSEMSGKGWSDSFTNETNGEVFMSFTGEGEAASTDAVTISITKSDVDGYVQVAVSLTKASE